MKKEEYRACNNIVNFNADLNDVLSAVCRLDDENKQLKSENTELKLKIESLEMELGSRGGTISGRKIH